MRTSQKLDCPALYCFIQLTGEIVPVEITSESKLEYESSKFREVPCINLFIKTCYGGFCPINYNIRCKFDAGCGVVTEDGENTRHQMTEQIRVPSSGRVCAQDQLQLA